MSEPIDLAGNKNDLNPNGIYMKQADFRNGDICPMCGTNSDNQTRCCKENLVSRNLLGEEVVRRFILEKERQRMIEKFRPVIEKLEEEHSRKPFNPMCDCNLCFALEVLTEIEKQG